MKDHLLSITDFITDGSLFRLCDVLGRLTGSPVFVRDAEGRVILGLREGAVVYSADDGSERRKEAHGAVLSDDFSVPLLADGREIGRIVMPGHEAGETTEQFRNLIQLLASTVSEACDREVEQRRRAEELQTLYKLSSMLVGAGSVEQMLDVGLRSATEVLDADAGLVRLYEEEGTELSPRATVGLSPEAIRAAEAPFDEASDQAALAGEVASVEDCGNECACGDRLRRKLIGAGMRSMVCAGLIFRGKPLGVMTLYTQNPHRFSDAERGLLQSIAQQLAAAVANARLIEAQAASQRVSAQVKLAADVQRRMMPRSLPEPPGLDIATRYAPCFELGGDFYDLFDLGGHVGMVVGDVVGKGVAAGLLMSHVRASLRAHARDIYDLDQVIALTNEALCRDTQSNEFATIFYGVIDPLTRRMTYCNAGHDAPIVVHPPAAGAPTLANISELSIGGMVVGVDPSQRYQRGSFDFRTGDVLVMATDGLADAMNFQGQKFGKMRIRHALLDLLAAEPAAPAKRIADHLLWEMRRFAGLSERVDDTTLVVMRVL